MKRARSIASATPNVRRSAFVVLTFAAGVIWGSFFFLFVRTLAAAVAEELEPAKQDADGGVIEPDDIAE